MILTFCLKEYNYNMIHEMRKLNANPKTKQIDFDFDTKPDTVDQAFEKEKEQMGKFLGLMDLSKLSKKDGIWYVGYLTADEWLQTLSGNDHTDPYRYKKGLD